MPWDVFDSDPFSTVSLTAAINEAEQASTRIGDMGLFQYNGVPTIKIAIERQQDQLALVPVTPRHSPPTQNVSPGRNILSVEIPRLAMEDSVFADEVQAVRAFGSETAVQTLQSLVNDKLARMNRKIDVTMEYHRMGALLGTVLDADASTLFDLFTLFGVSAQSTVDFTLGTATTNIRLKCNDVIRAINDELGGITATGGYHAFVGRTFMTKLVTFGAIEETYKYQQGAALRGSVVGQTLSYGGIVFEEYDLAVGGTDFIGASDGIVFPLGVPDMFIGRYGPPEWWDTVNTIGLPRYARQFPDQRDERRNLEVRCNPIHLNTRPRAVVPITTSN